ncbi:hypothetical protein QE152_g15966 [Popillia japonica]|uniref:Uncharacterized protein n=1 Tax=Popillia japonica TaxID=7064 RepID=A0AAW1L7H3_POPJA
MESKQNLNLKQDGNYDDGHRAESITGHEKGDEIEIGRQILVGEDIFKPRNSISRTPPRSETPVGHRADQTRCPHYRKLIYEKTTEMGKTKRETKDRSKDGPEKP